MRLRVDVGFATSILAQSGVPSPLAQKAKVQSYQADTNLKSVENIAINEAKKIIVGKT